MFGKYIHPQLVDDLAVALCARFNMKSDPKIIIQFINNFGYDIEKGEEIISSGFPIGKIMSTDHYETIKKEAEEKEQYFNIKSGRWVNEGNTSLVYGEGWCAKRNSPEHLAIIKIDDENKTDYEIEIDEKNDWLVVKGTNYIWSKNDEAIVGRLKNGKPATLTHKAIKLIKETNYKWKRINDDELQQCKL